jgi:hypothetical protein
VRRSPHVWPVCPDSFCRIFDHLIHFAVLPVHQTLCCDSTRIGRDNCDFCVTFRIVSERASQSNVREAREEKMAAEIRAFPAANDVSQQAILLAKLEGHRDQVNKAQILDSCDGVISISEDK